MLTCTAQAKIICSISMACTSGIVLLLLQVLWGYIFGMLLFGEKLTLFGVLGTCLIAVGMGCVTTRTKPQTQTQKAAAVRDLAGSGVGSVLLPVRQPQSTGPGGNEASSASFVARHLSFQRLLRNHTELADSSSVGDHVDQHHNSDDTASLLPNVQQHIPDDGTYNPQQNQLEEVRPLQDDGRHVQEFHNLDPAGSSVILPGLLRQHPLPTAAAGDAELVPLSGVQHRHHPHKLEQQQQQQESLVPCHLTNAALSAGLQDYTEHSGAAVPVEEASSESPGAVVAAGRWTGIAGGGQVQLAQSDVGSVQGVPEQQHRDEGHGKGGLIDIPLGQ